MVSCGGSPVIAGGLLAVAAACCFEVGYVLQAFEARSADHASGRRGFLLARLLRRRRWAAGTALAGLGAGLQVLALTLAPLTLVQPTLALGLVLLLVLARAFLREPVGPVELAGVAAVVTGITVTALTVPGESAAGYEGVGIAVLLALLGVLATIPIVAGSRLRDPRTKVLAAAAGDAWAAIALKLVADSVNRAAWLVAAAWGAGAALAGVLALNAEMSALQRLPAARVAPVILAAQVLVPVIGAWALLGEKWGETPLGGSILAAAVLLVGLGAWVLGSSRPVRNVLGGRPSPTPAGAREDDVGR
ncbi:MAG: hypothetical protein ACR2ML_03175 [Solirubrobacteraceae bacterium]